MHRPTIIFFFQQKTTNRNNQSNQTIRKNNPRNHSIKNTQKTNRQNKHEKLYHQLTAKPITRTTTTNNPHNLPIKNTQRQTQQAVTKKCNVFEYYNIADGNYLRANLKYTFYKNSTQPHKKKPRATKL